MKSIATLSIKHSFLDTVAFVVPLATVLYLFKLTPFKTMNFFRSLREGRRMHTDFTGRWV